ncbi:hypothetical protein [Bernardetia sp.]|uniref:hypothetical protein n=1 Tax=Bernardetia sp. TaxID=1937974 RepID=UPI0025C230E2|nr:hypothetical protein [Bernardetia sp.]
MTQFFTTKWIPLVSYDNRKDYLNQVQKKVDKISDKFVILFFIIGVCLVPVYDTWFFTWVTIGCNCMLYLMVRLVLQESTISRVLIAIVYTIFMLQFIGQLHGMAEMHFFYFINATLLIIYQDWKMQLVYALLAIGHHTLLALLQWKYGTDLSQYFIGYGGITFFRLFFHFGLAFLMSFICGLWAYLIQEVCIQASLNKTLD